MLRALSILTAASLLLVAAPAVHAAQIGFTATLSVELLPGSGATPVSVNGNGTAEVNPDGSFQLAAGVFQFNNATAPADLIPDTLVPGDEIVSVDGANAAGFFSPAAGPGGFGGLMPIVGNMRYLVSDLSPGIPSLSLPLPASLVGGVGGTTLSLPLSPTSAFSLFIPAAGWQTATRQFIPALGLLSLLSGALPTPPTSLPSLTPISTAGFDARTAGGLGVIQMVAPVTVQSLLLAPEGIGLALGRLTIEFGNVPEPGTAALLASSVLALGLAVRRRRG